MLPFTEKVCVRVRNKKENEGGEKAPGQGRRYINGGNKILRVI